MSNLRRNEIIYNQQGFKLNEVIEQKFDGIRQALPPIVLLT